MVYYLITGIQEIFDWINSLPDRVKAILQGCVLNFINASKSLGAQIENAVNITPDAFAQSLLVQTATDEAAAPQPSEVYQSAITDPINYNLNVLSSKIEAGVNVAKDTAYNNIGQLKSASSKP